MAKIRYKNTGTEAHSDQFNIFAIAEVLTGDDSAFIKDLDVFIEAKGEWVDMRQAFQDRDLIPCNYNEYFFEPATPEDKERGYTL